MIGINIPRIILDSYKIPLILLLTIRQGYGWRGFRLGTEVNTLTIKLKLF